MQNNSVNKGIFYFFGTRIWASMPVYQHENPSRFVTDSVQINIKFTVTIYEYILLSNYIYNIYITLCFFVFSSIVATHTHTGHTGSTFT